jgi:hypothetical protein
METTPRMSASAAASEPVGLDRPTGSTSAGWSDALVAAVRAWAGERAEAVVLAGSHATGRGAWREVEGRWWSLSDLDVYAVLPNATACDAARRHMAREPRRWDGAAHGFAAPLEVAFLTRSGLAAQPARPGTLALAAHGRVLWGDAGVMAALPRWIAADIPAEERLTLVENRGFELLAAAAPAAPPLALPRARHAVLKTAEDLAGALALTAGEWPADDAARRAAAERGRQAAAGWPLLAGSAGALEPLPSLVARAAAWRAGTALAADAAEWAQVVRAWCVVWARLAAPDAAAGAEPWPLIAQAAARDPWLRRWRRSLGFRPRRGVAPALLERARLAPTGTPPRRLAAAATTLLFAAASSAGTPALPAGALRLLSRLAVVRARDWHGAAAEARATWAAWIAGLAPEEA